MRYIFCLFLTFISIGILSSQKLVDISIKINHYDQSKVLFSYYYGGNIYVKDTLKQTSDGDFKIQRDSLLPRGLYVIYTLPDKQSFEIVISDDQQFSINTDFTDIKMSLHTVGSKDNELYIKCLQSIDYRKVEITDLSKKMEYLKGRDDKLTEQMKSRLIEIADSMRLQQLSIISEYPDLLAKRYILAAKEPQPPKFDLNDKQKLFEIKWRQKNHFFDNIDFSDLRHYRSPYVFNQIKFLIGNYFRHPDSLESVTKLIISKFSVSGESYQTYFDWLIKYYALSNQTGFDRGYVYMVKNYIMKNKTPWIKSIDSLQFVKSAIAFERVLIGNKAPDINLPDNKGHILSLYNIDSSYTLVYFGDPDCTHCKEALPALLEVFDTYNKQGLGIYGVCTRLGTGTEKCFRYAEANLIKFPIVADGEKVVKVLTDYNLTTYPQYFILDRNKKIVAKNINDKELFKVVDYFMKKLKK
ncbi:MAG TPA: redoxin domain-containing protein [Saprospiraceae bacterium]|nr:redoxin domain-containing protein [Saprospiraceae bacterium]